MTPEEAVTLLADLLTANHEAPEETLYRALVEAGLTNEVADKAYKFAQIAWGRVFLNGLGITFSDDYLWLGADGSLIEAGKLAEEPFFLAATQLAGKYSLTPAFARLALTSADVHAVNNALNNGAQTENLATGPTCLFIAEPTPEGLERAGNTVSEFLKG